MMDDPYTVLNVYPDCTYEEAKAAYRKAALMHHPDRHPPARKDEAARRFRILAQAFHQICSELGHPIEPTDVKPGGSPARSSSSSRKSHSTTPTVITAKNSPAPNGKAPALTRGPSVKAISQPPKVQKAISGKAEPAGRSENALQARPPATKSHPKASQVDEPEEEYSSEESEHEPSYNSRQPSRLPPSTSERNEHVAEYPIDHYSGHPRPQSSRRSSFTHPRGDLSRSREPVNDYHHHHHPLGPKQYARQPQYPEHREQLYSLPGNGGRDKEWDFGLGGDDFFSSGADRFGPGSSMMNDMSSGFDRMMSTAFKGLNMAGPDPAELARMDSGQNCSMRMRQSKMVMGRTEDGTWAGKRMEKQMNMADGRIEVNENAQDIRMGGRAGGSSRYPPRNGNVRGNAEDWDPPPAYQGGGEENYGPEGYGPNMQQYQPGYQHPQPRHGGHPAALDQGGYGGYGEMVPGPRRQASVSRSRHSASGVDGYPDGGGRLQRRPSSRFDYGSELAHASRPPPMGHPAAFAVGPPPMGRSLARRPSGDVGARY
ncbi:hypothetical protein MJO28_001041 [Puccinia striiformis f. sp. tritici]|uniref:J domain-containing protein n=2 Tax=Puccinia striiformis TaxID=27350 RepID=A0A2S4WNP8_9BASI|nr:hypothetical protein MJO28_001041 [Puccinia striiformis f. sp. tritici]POW23354.1 hypothetical protein PSHT_00301 [Puccinia striiformis]